MSEFSHSPVVPSAEHLEELDQVKEIFGWIRDGNSPAYGFVFTDDSTRSWAVDSMHQALVSDGLEVVGGVGAAETLQHTLQFLYSGRSGQRRGNAILDLSQLAYDDPAQCPDIERTVSALFQGRTSLSHAAMITAIVMPDEHKGLINFPPDLFMARGFQAVFTLPSQHSI